LKNIVVENDRFSHQFCGWEEVRWVWSLCFYLLVKQVNCYMTLNSGFMCGLWRSTG